ncbi:PQQ-dependent sugar dehydrogenase [Flavobacterium psychrotolerans]|uniref:Cadherin n=1 Tax=Flavobacterium psychrotolerans TaxID=2169410 RepID=A0A2U1JJN9_9FLAO|nr:PQQ-dependent sugar dehydrogenase [Flavobacterium psychrotolerans]PWA05209.1 cadherin [Flavobacterium psychrotolerans]
MKTVSIFLVLLIPLFLCSQIVGIQSFATGFTSPIEVAHPEGDSRLFIVEQGGKIKILNSNGETNIKSFLTLTTSTISTGGERGLLGLTFHPKYSTNGYFYVNYTNIFGNTVIARYSVSTDPDVADASSGTILLTINQPFANHNGGSVKFGPDGYLYIGMGDGGSAGDPGNRAQNPNELLGKMLRIDVDSDFPYGIPPTNPFVESLSFRKEIWAIGLRNPWKFSFDKSNGDLWIADVGQNQIEEINKVSSTVAGLNYGWNCYEGNSVYAGCTALPITYTFPLAQYTHSFGCSITGGYAYAGTTYPNFQGKYFFADYCSNKIGMLDSSGTIVWSTAFKGTSFATFGEDYAGELYIAGSADGVIYKIIDTSLGVNGFHNKKIELYPNPATTEFFIQTKAVHLPAFITISDVTGKLLLYESLEAETSSISISTLQSGFYLVNIKSNNGENFSSKLTIKQSF